VLVAHCWRRLASHASLSGDSSRRANTVYGETNVFAADADGTHVYLAFDDGGGAPTSIARSGVRVRGNVIASSPK
jgi:hypothetical protein